MKWLVIIITVTGLLAACGADTQTTTTPVPTRTLVPSTPTLTPVPVVWTPTPTDLPAPLTLVPATPAASALVMPPTLQAVIERTIRDLVENQGIEATTIRLIGIDAFTWRDRTWGCRSQPSPDLTHPSPVPGYRLIFTADNRVYVYHTGPENVFFLCSDEHWLALEGEPVLSDPIAAGMVGLLKQTIAQQTGITQEQIALVSLLTVNWSDTSLGCPRPGGVTEDRLTPGYRAVFQAGDTRLIYHTSSRDFVRCVPDEEILPGMLRRALPAP